MKLFLSIIILIQLSFAYEVEHFLLPKDGDKAENMLVKDILNAKHSISVAMFMVTNKKLTNALKERAKKSNIDIKIIADKSYDKAHQKISKVKKLVSQKNIKTFSLRGLSKKKKKKFGILHSKLVVIDDNITYIGSTNWTKSAFHSNYEILIKFTDSATAKMYKYYFDEMLSHAKFYSLMKKK